MSNSNELAGCIQAAGFLTSQTTHLWIWLMGLLTVVAKTSVLASAVKEIMQQMLILIPVTAKLNVLSLASIYEP